jgi:hypothetical protein
MAKKSNATGWSVAGQKKLEKIRDGMPPEMVQQIRQEAADQAVADVFGADWKEHVDVHGNPQEQGIGSTA